MADVLSVIGPVAVTGALVPLVVRPGPLIFKRPDKVARRRIAVG